MTNAICLKCNNKIHTAQPHYGLHPECFHEWFNADTSTEFRSLARKDSISLADPQSQVLNWNASFFHGKFLKYSAELAQKSYIIKLQEESYPELPYVEYLCNLIGRKLRINFPPFYLIEFYGKPAFITENLISKRGELSTLEHIYHHFNPDEPYDCETLITIIQRETKNLNDIDHLISVCLFDALIGNHDRHGRNLGFLCKASNKILCPAYDNTTALGLETGEILKATFNPTGKIFTKFSHEPSMHDYVLEFSRLGYQKNIEEFRKRIDLSEIKSLINDSFCSDLMKVALSRLIHSRYEELSDAI